MVSSLGKVGAIIQARARSRRLPGKVLLKLPFDGPHSIIDNVISRARRVTLIDAVVVATSRDSENNAIAASVTKSDAVLFRGSEDNVLERFHQAATEYGITTIVRLTADNPCIDPNFIYRALQEHAKHAADYTKTVGLPVGMNVEVISAAALKRVFETAERVDDKEHVTLYVNRNLGQFKTIGLDLAKPGYADLRVTVDWKGDYAFACFLYDHLYHRDPYFGLDRVMELLDRHPWAKMINGDLQQEKQFAGPNDEMNDAVELMELHGLRHTAAYLRTLTH
ncbi:MAG: glycosyltransferase family protein [Proteobacteria bacterium]|nr:glycosyltransferase family protein [Pseudomonadota bacterium]